MLTDWFPGSVIPVRKGVYQRQYPLGKTFLLQYAYWDGEAWFMGSDTPDSALGLSKTVHAPRQRLSWRGLTK